MDSSTWEIVFLNAPIQEKQWPLEEHHRAIKTNKQTDCRIAAYDAFKLSKVYPMLSRKLPTLCTHFRICWKHCGHCNRDSRDVVSCEDKIRAKHCIRRENPLIQRDTGFHGSEDGYMEILDDGRETGSCWMYIWNRKTMQGMNNGWPGGEIAEDENRVLEGFGNAWTIQVSKESHEGGELVTLMWNMLCCNVDKWATREMVLICWEMRSTRSRLLRLVWENEDVIHFWHQKSWFQLILFLADASNTARVSLWNSELYSFALAMQLSKPIPNHISNTLCCFINAFVPGKDLEIGHPSL